jgi:hypothetical protein
MRPHSVGQYVNTTHADDADCIGEAHPPARYARLGALKRRYDPANMFRHNQNMVPG